MFLNRMCEKNDKESAGKFNNFVTRNKEFRDKKSLKLQERSDKISSEMNAMCTGVPNGKVFDKSELRNPDEFLNDQLKYYNTRDLNVNQQREDIVKTTNAKFQSVPEISKKSKQLAENRLVTENNDQEVYNRLFHEKLNKEKKHIYTEGNILTEVEVTTKSGKNKKTKKAKKQKNQKKNPLLCLKRKVLKK